MLCFSLLGRIHCLSFIQVTHFSLLIFVLPHPWSWGCVADKILSFIFETVSLYCSPGFLLTLYADQVVLKFLEACLCLLRACHVCCLEGPWSTLFRLTCYVSVLQSRGGLH